MGYTRQALLNDMDRIQVKQVKKGDKKEHHHDGADAKGYCKLHDWVTVHYKAFTKAGSEVQNSYTAEDPKRPKVFQLGHFEVSKCWDISLQQAKQGDTIKVRCPGDLDQGGDKTKKTDTAVEFSKEPVDLDYEFDVVECGANPPSLQESLPAEALVPGKCFYIVSYGKWGKGSKIALNVEEHDKSDGWSIYDVNIGSWDGVKEANPAHQWMYNAENHTIESLLHRDSNGVLFEGLNKNLIVYAYKNMPH